MIKPALQSSAKAQVDFCFYSDGLLMSTPHRKINMFKPWAPWKLLRSGFSLAGREMGLPYEFTQWENRCIRMRPCVCVCVRVFVCVMCISTCIQTSGKMCICVNIHDVCMPSGWCLFKTENQKQFTLFKVCMCVCISPSGSPWPSESWLVTLDVSKLTNIPKGAIKGI